MKKLFVIAGLIGCCFSSNLLSMQWGGGSTETFTSGDQTAVSFFNKVMVGDREYVDHFLARVGIPSSLNVCDAHKNTPLHIAVQRICILKSRGLGIELTEENHELCANYLNIIHSILGFYAHTYCAASMLARRNFLGFTPFLEAAYGGDMACVQAFLAARDVRGHLVVDINAVDFEGNTGLILVANQGYVDVMAELLADERINVDLQSNDGDTALIWAAARNHVDCVRLLLDHRSSIDGFFDVEVNLVNKKGESALWWAVANNNQEIFDLLINCREELGFLRLNLACLQAAKVLAVEKGFDGMSAQLTPVIDEVQNDILREGKS